MYIHLIGCVSIIFVVVRLAVVVPITMKAKGYPLRCRYP